MMNIRLLFFTLLMPLFVQAQGDNADVIEWRANRKLNWDDFKGNAPEGSQEAALTNCGFGYASNNVNRFEEAKFTVTVQFYRSKSWVHHDKESVRLLQHEQRHFDLSELYARQFRKRLSERKWTGADLKKAEKIYQDLFKELDDQQHKYDEETIHGLDTEKQNQWNETIAKELKDLSAFGMN